MTKAELRQQVRSEAKKHSAEERRVASAQLCDVLRAHTIWKSAGSVLLFMALADEPDVSTLANEALRDGKSVALPAFVPDSGIYQALQVRDLQRDLAPGPFGISEPCATCAPIPIDAFDLIFVPGLAFSANGVRLGRGKGFYDRLLAQTARTKCGIAFEWQLLPKIPTEAHDVSVDFLATPLGVIAKRV